MELHCEYFASSASIERVFRDYRARLKSDPAHVIMAELVVGFIAAKLTI